MDSVYESQLEELAETAKSNGRMQMATEVILWAQRNRRRIDDIAMTELVILCAPVKP